MALPINNWAQGDVFAFGGTTALLAATAFKAAIDAHPKVEVTADSLSGGGPSYYIEFKHSAGPLTDMRYIVGFGALPGKRMTGAPGSDSSYIWVGFSQDADTTGPDAAWTAAEPYTSGRFAGFVALKGYSGTGAVDQVYLKANDEQVCIVVEDTGVSPFTAYAVQMGANVLPSTAEFAEVNGRCYGFSHTGYGASGLSTSGPFSNGSGYGGLMVGYAAFNYNYGYVYLPGSSTVELVYGYLTSSLSVTADAFTTPGGKIVLCPFPLYGVTRAKVIGAWRQIYPFRGLRRQVIQDATPADTGYVLAISDGTVYPAALFANA